MVYDIGKNEQNVGKNPIPIVHLIKIGKYIRLFIIIYVNYVIGKKFFRKLFFELMMLVCL